MGGVDAKESHKGDHEGRFYKTIKKPARGAGHCLSKS